MTDALENVEQDNLVPLASAFLRNCRANPKAKKIADSTGDTLTAGQVLMRSLILRRLLDREVLTDNQQRVGVLIPPANGGVIVNAALALAKRVAVNLNYSASPEVMNACIQAAGLTHVLTSRRVYEKLSSPELDAEIVFLEDLRPKITTKDKLAGMLGAFVVPASATEKKLGLRDISLDDPATIIFTSGSTGRPKGVVLSHRNLLHNIRAINSVISLTSDDVILGILPFFHAFGYTVTLWTPLVLGMSAVYHFSPLDAKQVGKIAKKHGATILLSTPTFLRSYLKRVKPEEFASLEIVVVGAEKMPIALADAFESRFGVRPVEGYGATELAPLVSVNVPVNRSNSDANELCEGSIGKPVPEVRARIIDPDTKQELAADQEGMLEIAGPNLMLGYLDDQTKTNEVVHDGWYTTGDMARIDSEGFIFITGRQSRFSKIAGEMVPHIHVEEEIERILADGEDIEEPQAVVSSAPDERKGERLVVVHLAIDKTPKEICEALQAAGLPNLWIPSPDSFLEVEELPLLGSGKLDLKALAKVAHDHFAPQ